MRYFSCKTDWRFCSFIKSYIYTKYNVNSTNNNWEPTDIHRVYFNHSTGSVFLFCLSVYLSVYLSTFLSINLSLNLSINLPKNLSINLSIILSIFLSVYLPIFLPECCALSVVSTTTPSTFSTLTPLLLMLLID